MEGAPGPAAPPPADDAGGASGRRGGLGEIAALFLRLGATSFGGPAAHIAMMRDEVVVRRGWVTERAFLDLVGVTQLMPGPNSTELAIHLGHERGGWPGLVVAGVCFIGPAALLTGAAAWAYVRFGALPQAGGVLYGVKPVMIAIVVHALVGLGKAALRGRHALAAGAAAFAASLAGAHELAALAGAGALAAALRPRGGPGASGAAARAWAWPAFGAAAAPALAAPAAAAAATPGGLFALFLKTGSVLFGSGYVLLAFLRADLVRRAGWLTEAQLLDAVAVGQITPGPVFSTATFVGYVLAGPAGAAAATAGIFLPAFAFVALGRRLAAALRRSPAASAALDGVNAASLALMAIVTWTLGRGALVDPPAAGIALASAVALVRYRVNTAWLVLFGGLAGLALARGP